MSGKRVHDHYEDQNYFIIVLEAAEEARPRDPKAAKFIEETRDRFNTYGGGMYWSDKQKAWLERIAEDVK